jgi:hypothetical protein
MLPYVRTKWTVPVCGWRPKNKMADLWSDAAIGLAEELESDPDLPNVRAKLEQNEPQALRQAASVTRRWCSTWGEVRLHWNDATMTKRTALTTK